MKRVLNVAHRGIPSLYPENTLIGFRKAAELNVDMIELDIHRSRDGVIVVIHDHELDRTTDGAGKVAELSSTELKSFSAGRRYAEEFAAERIPFLSEVFELLAEGGPPLRIEIKQPGIESDLISLIARHKMETRVVCSFFHLPAALAVRRIAPRIPVAAIFSRAAEIDFPALLAEGISMVDVAFGEVDERFLSRAHAQGITVTAWTVDEKEDMRRMIRLGVDGITTNRPQDLKDVILS